ncbi:MAG: hypothetical protein HY716_03300 [Planctomycetes bacterium]|nr:hypothetical protein [Planctomycetota bacterium]
MINHTLIVRLTFAAASASLAAAALGYAATDSFPVAGAVVAGAMLGLVPFISWNQLVHPLMEYGHVGRIILLTFGKLALYGSALYLLVILLRLPPLPLGAGLLLSTSIFIVGSLASGGPRARAGTQDHGGTGTP